MAHPTQVEPSAGPTAAAGPGHFSPGPILRAGPLRISVADVEQAGPFSAFPGVDRWFAVLEGDGVRLATAGDVSVVLRVGDEQLHAFPGDAATACELLGGATQDLNVMVRRREARATIRRLRDSDPRSGAELLMCFVCDAATLTTDDGAPIPLARHTLAWLENPDRETLALKLAAPAPRGWWIEATRTDR